MVNDSLFRAAVGVSLAFARRGRYSDADWEDQLRADTVAAYRALLAAGREVEADLQEAPDEPA